MGKRVELCNELHSLLLMKAERPVMDKNEIRRLFSFYRLDNSLMNKAIIDMVDSGFLKVVDGSNKLYKVKGVDELWMGKLGKKS